MPKKPRRKNPDPPKSAGFRGDRRWIALIPILGVAWVWASSLSFVPVPWPDDSAFYFPAKDLFAWPPRWVMIPQAPFEPTYREWNFNTMPLFPILIGLLRLVGVAGSHSLKLLPLLGWLASILLVLRALRRDGACVALLLVAAGVLTFDPILRWSSVLLRPESIIGATGVFILFGFRFGWPERLRERRFFHPVSLALLVGAYLHFNAIHLVPMVIVLYAPDWRKILKIGGLTAVGLVPWLATIAMKPSLFVKQMELQFGRLAGYHNPWLDSWDEFMKALLNDMGAPEPWAPPFRAAIALAAFAAPVFLAFGVARLRGRDESGRPRLRSRAGSALLGALAWVLAAAYLWHTKAEVWFTHFLHLAFWSAVLLLAREASDRARGWLLAVPGIVALLFLYGQVAQTIRLESTRTWHWSTYDRWIECIDSFLVAEHAKRGHPREFRVWDPTYPDVTIELSRRHPEWEFTRTNDFYRRWDLGVTHGHAVDAVVVTEIFRENELEFDGPQSARPEHRSVWMNWEDYFLVRLERDPQFKPRRFLCQRGRWDAFIYLNE